MHTHTHTQNLQTQSVFKNIARTKLNAEVGEYYLGTSERKSCDTEICNCTCYYAYVEAILKNVEYETK
jgi:hypothetical protein